MRLGYPSFECQGKLPSGLRDTGASVLRRREQTSVQPNKETQKESKDNNNNVVYAIHIETPKDTTSINKNNSSARAKNRLFFFESFKLKISEALGPLA